MTMKTGVALIVNSQTSAVGHQWSKPGGGGTCFLHQQPMMYSYMCSHIMQYINILSFLCMDGFYTLYRMQYAGLL